MKLSRLRLVCAALVGTACGSTRLPADSAQTPAPAGSPSSPARDPIANAAASNAPTPAPSARVPSSPPSDARLSTAELLARFGPPALAERAKFKDVRLTTSGNAARRYVLLEPIGVTAPAPVVLFFHGWDGENPKFYGAWLDYLVRQGQIVVFVGYQTRTNDLPSGITAVAYESSKAALRELEEPGHVAHETRVLGAIGYSMGASIALNLSHSDDFPDIPPIGGLFLANPADGPDVPSGKHGGSIRLSTERLPRSTRIVIAIAESDPIARGGTSLYAALCRLPSAQRNLVMLRSDKRGALELRADHVAPSANWAVFDADPTIRVSKVLPERAEPWAVPHIDALDVFGYWKLADGLLDAIFGRPDRGGAFGDGVAVRFQGAWPDGTAVRAATVDATTCEASE